MADIILKIQFRKFTRTVHTQSDNSLNTSRNNNQLKHHNDCSIHISMREKKNRENKQTSCERVG